MQNHTKIEILEIKSHKIVLSSNLNLWLINSQYKCMLSTINDDNDDDDDDDDWRGGGRGGGDGDDGEKDKDKEEDEDGDDDKDDGEKHSKTTISLRDMMYCNIKSLFPGSREI